MAYQTGSRKQYYNSEVDNFDDKYIWLRSDDATFKIERKYSMHFKPMYAMTVHEAYSIFEYKRMKHDMLYVALTRTSKKEYVNVCKKEIYKPYVGYIYRYSYNDMSYI
eukprot:766372-Amphidinium_carterae.1